MFSPLTTAAAAAAAAIGPYAVRGMAKERRKRKPKFSTLYGQQHNNQGKTHHFKPDTGDLRKPSPAPMHKKNSSKKKTASY